MRLKVSAAQRDSALLVSMTSPRLLQMRSDAAAIDVLLRSGPAVCALMLGLMWGAGTNVLLRVPILVVAGVLAVWWLFRSPNIHRPATVLIVVWSISFAGFFSGVVTPLAHWPLTAAHAYLVAALLCVVGGSHWASRMTSIRRPSAPVILNQIVVDIFAAAGLVSTVLFMYEMLVLNSVDLSDMSGTRLAFQMRDATVYSYIELLTRPGAVIALCVVIVFWEVINPLRRFLYAVSGISLALQGVASAGRFTILLIFMVMVYAFGLRRARGLPMLPGFLVKAGAVCVFTVLGAYIFYVSATRSVGSFENAPYRYFLLSSGTEINHDVMRAGFEELPMWVRTAIVSSYSYLALPIGHFAVFWNVYQGEPAWGALEYPLVSRNLARLELPVPNPNDVLEERFSEFQSYGEPAYTWQTAVRDSVVDFGVWGALLAAFVFGVILQNTYQKVITQGELGSLVVGLSWWMVAVHSPLYSIAGEPTMFILLLTGYGLKTGSWRFGRSKRALHFAAGEISAPAHRNSRLTFS